MNILLIEFDLFNTTGGGQTVYQKIIEKRTDDTFYYFIEFEKIKHARPANTIAIPYKKFYVQNMDNQAKEKYLYDIFFQTFNMAA